MKIKNEPDYSPEPVPEPSVKREAPFEKPDKPKESMWTLEELKRLQSTTKDPIVLKHVTTEISEIRKAAAAKRSAQWLDRRRQGVAAEKAKEPDIKRRIKKRVDAAKLEHPNKPFAAIHEKYEQVVKNLFQIARKNDGWKGTRRLLKMQIDGADQPLKNGLDLARASPMCLTPRRNQILVYANVLGMGTDVKSLTSALDSTSKNTKSTLKLRIGMLVISPKRDSVLTDEQGIWAAQRHLTRLGVDINEHPWQLYKHLDSKSGIHHYHVLYNRVRLDGKVHYINGGSIVCNYEASAQDRSFELEPQIPFPVPHSRDKNEQKSAVDFSSGEKASTKSRSSFLKTIASFCHGKLNAELREKGKKPILVSTLGSEANARLQALGPCDLGHGGGFVKLQFFDGPDFIVRHCAI